MKRPRELKQDMSICTTAVSQYAALAFLDMPEGWTDLATRGVRPPSRRRDRGPPGYEARPGHAGCLPGAADRRPRDRRQTIAASPPACGKTPESSCSQDRCSAQPPLAMSASTSVSPPPRSGRGSRGWRRSPRGNTHHDRIDRHATTVNIFEMMDRARSREDVISMGLGDPDLATPDHIVAAAKAAIAEGRTGRGSRQRAARAAPGHRPQAGGRERRPG